MNDLPQGMPGGAGPEKKSGWPSFFLLIVSLLLIVAIKNTFWPRIQSLGSTPPPAVTLESKAAVMQKLSFEYGYAKPESNVMRAFFVIRNKSSRNVKDLVVTCWLYGPGGSGTDKISRVIYQDIGVGETKFIPPLDMGLVDPLTNAAACYITDLVLN